MKRAGLDRKKIHVRNTVSIWPGADNPNAPKAGSKKPSADQIYAERGQLHADLKHYKPDVVIGLGTVAVYSLISGTPASKRRMESLNGRVCPASEYLGNFAVVPSVHPAAGLHDPHQAVQTWLALQEAARFIKHGFPRVVEKKKRYIVLHGAAEVRAALRRVAWPRGIALPVDTEGYPGDYWSIQFATDPWTGYIILATDLEGLAAFNRYAPRPISFHNAMHDLDPLNAMGIYVEDEDVVCTLVKTYVTAREMAKGKTDSDEASVMGQGLKSLSFKYLFEDMIDFPDLVAEPSARVVREYLDEVWGSCLGPLPPKVVNKYTALPHKDDVGIMRGSKWGNPFKIQDKIRSNKRKGIKGQKGVTRAQVVKKYKEWIKTQPQLLSALPELVGKRLVCCCAPLSCHGDILSRLVSELPGPLNIPREGRAQPLGRRILNMMHKKDVVVKWDKLCEEKPKWRKQIEKMHGRSPRLTLAHIPFKPFVKYACLDAIVTGRLDVLQSAELDRMNLWQPYKIDMAILPMLRSMTNTGLYVNLDMLADLRGTAEWEQEDLHAKLMDLAAQFGMSEFAPDSNDDVAVLLFDKMKADHFNRKTPSGNRLAVDEKTLAGLPLKGRADKFRKLLLDYKEVQTLLTRYIYRLPKQVGKDGRVHPQWKHTVTVSGRLACQKPNLLAFPNRKGTFDYGKRLRACFTAGEGQVLLSADLSQIELRVLASESGDKAMVAAFKAGIDLHAQTTERIFKMESSDPEFKNKREFSKICNFGVAYGMSSKGLLGRLAVMGIESTEEECQRIIDAKHKEWPEAFAYLDEAAEECFRDGFARDMWDRIRYLPMIWSPVKRASAEAGRQAGNMKIQGGAQGVEKKGMASWWQQRDSMKKWNPLLQIHDDVVFQGPAEQAKEVGKKIQHIFEDAAQYRFPKVKIKCGLKFGDSWGTMKEPEAA